MKPDIYFLDAKVMHKRMRPRVNGFTYRVFYLAFDLEQIAQMKRWWFGINRFGLVGFHEKDYGSGGHMPLKTWMQQQLNAYGLGDLANRTGSRLMLITHPRLMGYVFNPVSFWLWLDEDSHIRAILAEVNNTFGERHCYLVAHPDGDIIQPDDCLHATKHFHVSPFFDLDGGYDFRFILKPTQQFGAWIDYAGDDGIRLHTSMVGRLLPFNGYSMMKLWLGVPFALVKTIGLIHYQAIKIILKRIRYRSKPAMPSHEVTATDGL